jgi:hypothetical protein
MWLASPVGTPWMWTLAFGPHEDRTPTHGYEATREEAMAGAPRPWRLLDLCKPTALLPSLCLRLADGRRA